jgi:transcriptional regulator NrdR family protein
MIRLTTSNLLVTDDQGRKQSFDTDLLRRDLRQAFRAVGVTEDWLAEHIALTVEERIRSANDEQHCPMAAPEVDKLVCTVLGAAGYNDVASEFSRIRDIDPLSHYRETMQPCSPERISALLRRSFPLAEAQLQSISNQCADILRQHAFSLVSDRFICELAIHVIHRGPTQTGGGAPGVPPAAATPATVLSDTSAWRTRVCPTTGAYLDSAALRALPLSTICPRARVAVDIASAFAAQDGGWLSELSLFSTVRPLCSAALELLMIMRDELQAQLPNCADAPSHVIFPGCKSFLESAFSTSKRRERLIIAQDLHELLQAALVEKAPFPLLLSMR